MPYRGEAFHTGLSFVICASRETPEDVQMTVDSILARRQEVARLEVIVADDNGDGQDRYGFLRDRCRVIVNEKKLGRGVTANLRFADALGHPVYPDAHMKFPEGSVWEFGAAIESGAIVCAGVRHIEYDHGCQGWGGMLRFHRGNGRGRLGLSYFRPKKEDPLPELAYRVDLPFGGCYGFRRDVFERIEGWTDLAERWGYCEQPLGYMAWVLDIPVLAIPSVINHRYRSKKEGNPNGAGDREIWMNVAYSHYVLFQPATWEHYWKPIVLKHINPGMLAKALSVPGTEERRERFQAMRPADKTDERFFTEKLGVHVTADGDGAVRKVWTPSIIMPAYNEGREALLTSRSILNSTKRDPEQIFVDDASDDGCLERFHPNGKELFNKDQVRILRNKTRIGVCRSRLTGIKYAQEDPLGFADSHSRFQPGDIDRLTDAAMECDGFVVATITGLGEKRPLYGSRFCIKPLWGLRGAYNLQRPKENLNRIDMAMGSCYFARREILERIRYWPPLVGKWAYSEQGIALKCWALDVPIYNLRDVLVEHKMAKFAKATEEDVLLNAHFVHRAYFDEDTYTDIWRPMLMERGHFASVDEMLKSYKPLLDEIEWYQSVRQHTDEEFFVKVLGSRPGELMKIDKAGGTAVPLTQAGYVAYEARRSPGREWLADRGRMERRHIPLLLAELDGKDRNTTSLLDVGCRDGYSLDLLQEEGFFHWNVMGIELSKWAAKHAKARRRFVVEGDAHNLGSWREDNFDVVTCIHCLEHCHAPSKVLAGINHVLRAPGLCMIVVPIEPTSLSCAGDHCYAMRSIEAVKQLIEAAGLKVFKIIPEKEDTTFFARKEA